MPPPSDDSDDDKRRRAFALALQVQGIGLLRLDAQGRFDLSENLPSAFDECAVVGKTMAELFSPDTATMLDIAQERLRTAGDKQTVDITIGEGLRRRFLEARLERDGDGTLIILSDVTEARTSEAAVATLLREVSHRSKNLLAIVQSVAMQTAQHSQGTQDFLDKFRGRLHALSGTQDLVTESDWRGTYLQTLVTAQLSRISGPQIAHVKVTGTNPLLTPNAALHVGLALHELGVNAVSHGALAPDRAGQVWIEASLNESQLQIEWREAGTEPNASTTARFGTMVLERVVPLSVGGTAQLQINDDGLLYRLTMPADQFEV